jgi:hypothetical protein
MTAEAAARKEPQLREAMALAYGHQLSLSELQALDRFLSTAEGVAFAKTSATIESNLGVFAARQLMDRAIVETFPAMRARLTEAMAKLPKVRDTENLSEAERKEIAQLLKVDPEQLVRH